MNKAFVREPDDQDPRCPGCGGRGRAVDRSVLEGQVGAAAAATLAGSAFYCAGPDCGVGYFDAWEGRVGAALIARPQWPKDPAAPVCPCQGLGAGEIEEDAKAGRRERVRAILALAAAPDARCRELTCDGDSCAAEVRRLFLRHFPTGD